MESELVSKILEGDVLAAARLMRGIEDELPDAIEKLKRLLRLLVSVGFRGEAKVYATSG